MSKVEVLIVEDEPEIAELIAFHLRREGFATRHVTSGRKALDAARENPPSVLVLDLMLPDLDGLEVCRRLKQREETRAIPIIMVTAKGEETDIVAGLELGGDDYITKPFSPRVLVARVRNVLRRHDGDAPIASEGRLVLADGALTIDTNRHVVLCHGQPIELTLTEFSLLHHLAQRPGFVRTRDQIIAFLLALVTLFALFKTGEFGQSLIGLLPEWLGGDRIALFVLALSPQRYFDSIARGVVDTGDLVFYLCFCAFFLHANALVLYGKRVKG